MRVTTDTDQTARIQMNLDYHPVDGPTVMTERRVVEVSAPDEDGTYFLDWVCQFTAGEKDVEEHDAAISSHRASGSLGRRSAESRVHELRTVDAAGNGRSFRGKGQW